jgi:hypothetical protein
VVSWQKLSLATAAVNEAGFTFSLSVLAINIGLAPVAVRLNWAKLVAWQTLFRRQFAYHPDVVNRVMRYWP